MAARYYGRDVQIGDEVKIHTKCALLIYQRSDNGLEMLNTYMPVNDEYYEVLEVEPELGVLSNTGMLLLKGNGHNNGTRVYLVHVDFVKDLKSTSTIDPEKLISSQKRWEEACHILSKFMDITYGQCSYCEQYQRFFKSNGSEGEECPLREVCGSCVSSTSHYSKIRENIRYVRDLSRNMRDHKH